MRTAFGVLGVDDCSNFFFGFEDTSDTTWFGAQGAWEIRFIFVENTEFIFQSDAIKSPS